ncbi:MAG TPA: nickel pincer cofactor biosynthesis protein LarC, partial [Anaerolineae bacterium]
ELAGLERELRKLHLDGYRLEAARVEKRGLAATQFKVILTEADQERLADTEFEELHSHPSHEHPHDHSHEHEHGHDNTEGHTHVHRALSDILALIAGSDLSEQVKANASLIFTRLGEAEAKVHGIPVDEVHFHEVGGVDAIVDIVSAAIGLEQLGVQRVIASPLHLGSGFVKMAHGLYPIPAPATAQLIQGVPVYSTEAKGELVTPTGAAIITSLARSFGPLPVMSIARVGYGAGTRDRDFPNVLRAMLGEAESPTLTGGAGTEPQITRAPRDPNPQQHAAMPGVSGAHEGKAIVIEANIDDMNPQLFEMLSDQLLAAGALDVILLPVQMKKQRPGVLLQVLSAPGMLQALLDILFRESTTIGVRTYEVTRYMLQRESVQVMTRYGPVRVKVARQGERVVNVAPEYEDCRLLAQQAHLPVKLVYAAALGAATEQVL